MRLNQFWESLASSQQAALLLDYDGTLAPFRIERGEAMPYPGIREKMAAINNDTETRLIIISGRAIDDLIPLLGMTPTPEVWGCHGWEHLSIDGARSEVVLPESFQEGLNEARNWIVDQSLHKFCETKPASLAIHWRGCSEEKIIELRDLALGAWQPIATDHQMEVHFFDGGLELRCPGRNKGTAIESILTELEADVAVAFLGDDLTDEDGFKVIKGRGLSVLVNAELRQTHADLRITPPSELFAFLDRWYTYAPRKSL